VCSSRLALRIAAAGYRYRVLMSGAQKAFGIAACAAAFSGCGSNPATTATETITVTTTPHPISAAIPLELPRGSVVYSRYVNEHTGAWVDMWAVPFEGPDAMTETEIIGYLQSRLPVGRPYDVEGSFLDWCRGGRNYWAWEKPASANPYEPGVIDRLYVHVVGSNYVQIERDQVEPLICESGGGATPST
jgi:hypothetical protein